MRVEAAFRAATRSASGMRPKSNVVMIRRGAHRYRGLRWLVLGMLCCVLVGYFGTQPFMGNLKEKALALGVGVSESPYKAQFGMLHGVSSVFYLLQSLLALALVWRASAPRSMRTRAVSTGCSTNRCHRFIRTCR